MHRSNSLLITLTFAWSISSIATSATAQILRQNQASTGQSVTLLHHNREREYRIHVPASYDSNRPVPLVVFLHGGGGNSAQGSRMGMTTVADKHGFIVVYPNAIEKHWNDGRKAEHYAQHDATIDDVEFIVAVIEKVSSEYKVDRSRVYAAGASNGGFMSQRLAIDRPDLFAAVGIMIATMGKPLSESFAPKLPVSVLYMNGTQDPLVPYDGGPVVVELFPNLAKFRRGGPVGRGICIATDEAVELWVRRNGLKSKRPTKSSLPDRDRDDGSTVEQTMWTGGRDGTAVALYRVIGGGHTVPGGMQYLPERIIGKTNRDIDGLETIWQFFDEHGRKSK
ncbi:MAG: prolyl oligopeptidase family serine peptidase [Pirellulaceae bacterium]|nr:prolyl oligopeptidase family serine peptidase [Pirellulaceae bacterium]